MLPFPSKRLPIENIVQVKEKWEEQVTTVSSLRLDSVLSSVLNMSRQKTQCLDNVRKSKGEFQANGKRLGRMP